MSSAITVAIRLDENTIISDERDAGRMARIVQHPDFIEGSREYLLAYANEDSPYKGRGLCAPSDVGIMAIDLPSRRIVTHCEYRNWLTRGLHSALTRLFFKHAGPYESLNEGFDIWRRLFEQKRVSLGVKWQQPSDEIPTTTAGDIDWPALATDRPAGPRWEDIPTAMEPLVDLKSAAERIQALEKQYFQSYQNKDTWPEIEYLHFDISPWVVEEHSFDVVGSEAAKQRLIELGFNLSEASVSAWDEWTRNEWREDEIEDV